MQHVRHEAAHAVVAWRSDAAEVESVVMRWPPHVRMYTRPGWDAGFEDAVIAAAGELAQHPTAYDDYEAFRSAQLLTDAHLVLAACSLMGQRGRRLGQRFWFEFVRDESLERLAMYRDDIDRVAAALADRGALDADDLVELLGPQVLRAAATPPRVGRSRRELHRPARSLGTCTVRRLGSLVIRGLVGCRWRCSLRVFAVALRLRGGGTRAAVGTPRVLLVEPDDELLRRWDAEAAAELDYVAARLAAVQR